MKVLPMILIPLVGCLLVGCNAQHSQRARYIEQLQHLNQKKSVFRGTIGKETDQLAITVTGTPNGGYTESGWVDVIEQQPDGRPKWTKHMPITGGEVATDGVPATIILSSHVVGTSDAEIALFFDKAGNVRMLDPDHGINITLHRVSIANAVSTK